MKALRDLITGIDGTTHDVARWGAVLTFLVGLGLEIFVVVWRSQPFDFTQFGIGVGAMATGLGAFIGLKAKTEPPMESP